MLDAKARDALDGLQRFAGSVLGRLGVSPNAITVTGVVLTGVASAIVIRGNLLVAGLVLILGGVLDFCDGAVAKATGRSTRFGAFLDSVSDRVSDALILSALVWYFAERGDDLGSALALATLVLALLTSYVRAKAESLGLDCKVGVIERAERVIIVIVGLLSGLVVPALALLVALSAVTVAQRLVHVRRQLR